MVGSFYPHNRAGASCCLKIEAAVALPLRPSQHRSCRSGDSFSRAKCSGSTVDASVTVDGAAIMIHSLPARLAKSCGWPFHRRSFLFAPVSSRRGSSRSPQLCQIHENDNGFALHYNGGSKHAESNVLELFVAPSHLRQQSAPSNTL